MEIRKFARNPFEVEAVKVTDENMQEVAEWCGGDVRRATPRSGSDVKAYVKVPAHNPLNEKQKRAFEGDWVLRSPAGFKVYTDHAMVKSFSELDKSEDAPAFRSNVFEVYAGGIEEDSVTPPLEQLVQEAKDELGPDFLEAAYTNPASSRGN